MLPLALLTLTARADHLQACRASFLDESRLQVVCGSVRQPVIDMDDLMRKQQEQDPDPFEPVGLLFTPRTEPLVVDLDAVKALDNGPNHACQGRRMGAAEVRTSWLVDSGAWDPELVEAVVEDTRRLQQGDDPLCFDVLGTSSPRDEDDGWVLPPPLSDDVVTDAAPVEPPWDEVAPTEFRHDANLVLDTVAIDLGERLRSEFEETGACPDVDLADVASLHHSFQPSLEALAPTDYGEWGTSCGYNPYFERWFTADFACMGGVCYDQVERTFPRTCNRLVRDPDGGLRTDESCLGLDADRVVRLFPLGHGTFLRVTQVPGDEPAVGLVFAPGTFAYDDIVTLLDG